MKQKQRQKHNTTTNNNNNNHKKLHLKTPTKRSQQNKTQNNNNNKNNKSNNINNNKESSNSKCSNRIFIGSQQVHLTALNYINNSILKYLAVPYPNYDLLLEDEKKKKKKISKIHMIPAYLLMNRWMVPGIHQILGSWWNRDVS